VRRKPFSAVVSMKRGVAPHQRDLLGVADPVRRGDQHLVARGKEREREVEERLLGAGRDDHLLLGVGHATPPSTVFEDGRNQRRDPADRGVLGGPPVERGLGGLANVRRGSEVGLTEPERDHVDPPGPHLRSPLGDDHRGRGLDRLEAFGEGQA
jgi:hypothetical protein